MKKIQTLIAALLLVVFSQNTDAQEIKSVKIDSSAVSFSNPDSIASRKIKAIGGLTNLKEATAEFKAEMNQAAADKNFKLADIKYFTREFIEIPFEQYRKYAFEVSGDWSEDSFVDKGYNRKAIVLRQSTAEEREKKISSLKGYFTAKKGTPIAQNEIELSKLVGQTAPDFTVTTLDGKKVSISSLKGKVVVLNFWFTMCKPCMEEIPDLNKIVKKYAGNKNVVFLAPEVRNETTVADVQKFLKRVPFSYQVALGGKDAAALYLAKTFPANFLIDKEGKVRMGWVGVNPFTLDEMVKMIPTLLK